MVFSSSYRHFFRSNKVNQNT